MKYKRWYDSIIAFRLEHQYEGYGEIHHIIPRSLGGTDSKSNLVKLSAREHFICHLLLVKMTKEGSNDRFKMLKAFNMLASCSSDEQQRYVVSRQYKRFKEEFSHMQSKQMIGSGNNNFGRHWISNPNLGLSKLVNKDVELDDGWVVGRNVKWFTCSCGVNHLHHYRKTCETCFKPRQNTEKPFGPTKPKKKRKRVVAITMACVVCNGVFLSKKPKKTCSSTCLAKRHSDMVRSITSTKRQVIDQDGKIFESLTDAANYHKITVEAIRYRIKIGKCFYGELAERSIAPALNTGDR